MNKELLSVYEVLNKVYKEKKYSQIELNKVVFSANDVNTKLITKIVYGVLDNDILLEYNLKNYYTKKPKLSLVILLKMGMYIKHYINSIPDFAAVNELVNISKKINKNYAGFVNAILKKVFSDKITYPNIADYSNYLSVKYSYPLWLVKMLYKEYGKSDVEKILSKELTTLTHIRPNSKIITFDKLVALLRDNDIHFVISQIDNAVYVDYDKILKYNEVFKDKYVVMGLTSMNLVDIIYKNIANYNTDTQFKVLDACASPGGKSLYLSEKMNNAEIISADIHEHRVELINNLVEKYDANNIKPILSDATVFDKKFENAFDLVVCDAPCSGIGVVNKKPDILLNRVESDIKSLSNLQKEIVNNLSKYVKVGGGFVYSTCTILAQENEDIVEEFLVKNPNFEIVDLNTYNDIKYIENKKTIKYLPSISDTEGFFIAMFTRKI